MTDVMVPSLGESVSEATVSTWFKKPGDAVKPRLVAPSKTTTAELATLQPAG